MTIFTKDRYLELWSCETVYNEKISCPYGLRNTDVLFMLHRAQDRMLKTLRRLIAINQEIKEQLIIKKH